MKVFRHSWLAHLICLGAILISGATGIYIATNGGIYPHVRWIFSGIVAVYILFVLFVYLTSCLNRYEITEEGLRIYCPFRSRLYPWSEIVAITWSQTLRAFFVHGSRRMIFYSSIDCFPQLLDFIRILHHQSKCKLSASFSKKLYPDQKP